MIRIALDGPSGAGKSTLAKAIAKRLSIVYLDTGALYRTVGHFVKEKETDPHDAEAVIALLPSLSVDVRIENNAQHVYLNGKDVKDAIRTPEMSMYASAVSAIPAVRAFLLETQRAFARTNSVIMDGRDIGTVIIPDADVKIFLTASDEIRARRRLAELREKGVETTYAETLADIRRRDHNDASRETAPALPAKDAIIFDNSFIDMEETVTEAIRIISARKGCDQ